MFRAGTLSRLKRLGLFRSCRREASSKTQGLSEDASHHAREHKTPTEGTAHGIHRSVPGNPLFRHSRFYAFQLKICCLPAKKVFGSTPFSKGVAGCRAGALQETLGAGGSPARNTGRRREPCKERRVAGRKPCKEQVGFILDFLRSRKYNGGEENGRTRKTRQNTTQRGEKK